ncbi:hypothetical protein D3C71_1768170 [compost metagenome]
MLAGCRHNQVTEPCQTGEGQRVRSQLDTDAGNFSESAGQQRCFGIISEAQTI